MYCRCHEYPYHPFRDNPITPDRLYKVLTMAIWPTDASTSNEADAARQIAVRFLVAIQPTDLPQLHEVLAKIMAVATAKPGALDKLLAIYQEAAKRNPILPPPNVGQPKPASKPAAKPAPKPGSRRVPKATPPPPSRPGATKPPPTRPKSSSQDRPEDEDRRAPRQREACRSCDGKGYRIKIDKENVMKETRVVCSKCGGTGREPPPSTGRGRGFRRGPHVEETEEEEDINRKADNFLRRHGLDKWGRGSF